MVITFRYFRLPVNLLCIAILIFVSFFFQKNNDFFILYTLLNLWLEFFRSPPIFLDNLHELFTFKPLHYFRRFSGILYSVQYM